MFARWPAPKCSIQRYSAWVTSREANQAIAAAAPADQLPRMARMRIELWAYSRRSPFLPWTGLDLLSWRPIAIRRAQWLGSIVDWLDRRGWKKQQWRAAGPWRDVVRP
jgi:hypothetical protein